MERPDPDQILKRVNAEEAASGRGRLKLFFGASPGVGKTYAMLEAAHQKKKEGWDVVVGFVETHGRVETEALLAGLEVLPRRDVSYKGITLKEFDLDAALKRRPRLILVDELAHTNAEGMRHAKRWQDVDELLTAGIDVYTTLNVQHWESLNDVVAQITGVVVRETVPDSFLTQTSDLELVDLSPEDLLKRLKDGKVYRGEVAGRATENFFQPGNLIALRELALRHAAERVDAQMRAFKEKYGVGDVWSVGERLLVGVTGGPMSARLVRAANRLATRLHAPWIAATVETPGVAPEDRDRRVNNMRLAKSLGAETITLTGDDVVDELLSLARTRNVTRILLGKPARSRWKEWIHGSVVNDMARRCGVIDLHIISGLGAKLSTRQGAGEPAPFDWSGAGWGAAVAALSTLLCWPLFNVLDRVNLAMIYLMGVAWTAYRFGRRASLVTAFLSVACFDFFFVPPYLTFAVTDAQYILTFGIMLGVALLISAITSRLRQQTLILRKREERLRALYQLSHDLSETPDVRRMLEVAQRKLEEYYKIPVLILTNNPQGDLVLNVGDVGAFGWNDNELSVARWVFDKGQLAGAGSDTLSGAVGLYLPLQGIKSNVGVLALRPDNPKTLLSPESLQLLEAFAGEIGGAVESTRMSEAIGRAEMQAELHAIAQPQPARDSKVTLSAALTPDKIVRLAEGLSKEEIIRTLLAKLSVPNVTQAFQAIMERENSGPTVIGEGLAIPHARLEGLKGIQAALGVTSAALWVVFLGPQNNSRVHLAFLSSLASFFQSEGRVQALTALNSTDKIWDYIRSQETA